MSSVRTQKLSKIAELGLNTHPYRFDTTHQISSILQNAEHLVEQQTIVKIAGRLTSMRRQGKAFFANLTSDHNVLQIYVRIDSVSEQSWELGQLLDLGDFIGATGRMMRTKRGELTLRIDDLTFLSKALRTLPIPKTSGSEEERVVHDAVKDAEFRYRQRYAWLAVDTDGAAVFRQRALIIHEMRLYMIENGFLEVETPVLQPIYGGAAAEPFTSHMNSLGLDVYLRIATELYLKRLIVGGYERVFEIGKDFRNEGLDRTHNPEFTMLEFYQAYADYTEMITHVEAIWLRCVQSIHGQSQIEYQGETINFELPWRKMTMLECIKAYSGLELSTMDDPAIQHLLEQKGWEINGAYSWGKAVAKVFDQVCEKELIQPTLITDIPLDVSPLARVSQNDPRLAERFELFVGGYEVTNAYSELNDSIEQEQIFMRQRGNQADEEGFHPYDHDYVRALSYGMPPTGGVGIGIDRMIMLLTDQSSIRDVVIFPLLKPE